MKIPYGYWNFDKCEEEALKYKTKRDFNKNCASAYVISLKNGWIPNICQHMVKLRHDKEYWTYMRCKEEALKYKSKIDFKKKSSYAYELSLKNNWLNDICEHMDTLRKPNGWWTYNRCKEEALKYSKRSDFNKFCSNGYYISLKNNWLDDICSHMKIIGNLKKRLVYVYEFSDNHAYVGLTFNFNERNNAHLNINSTKKLSQVAKHIIKTNIYPISKLLTKYIDVEEAKKLEKYYYIEYKNNGWNMLNKQKTGGVGGKDIIWTKENCLIELYKYNKIDDLRKNNEYVYYKIKKNNWY